MQSILPFIPLFVSVIRGEDIRFCDRNRKILLTGVFNYEEIIFAYSWKDSVAIQQQIVWRFQVNGNQLNQIGESSPVEQLFPGIPLFRTGFALKLKCNETDITCNSFNGLTFIFFQTIYKVFRLKENAFAQESQNSSIPWGLRPSGEARAFAFSEPKITVINAIVFMGGFESNLFIASKNLLFKSRVDLSAESLQWTKLTQSPSLTKALGGFISGNLIVINENAESDGAIAIYEPTGELLETTTVWKQFGCDRGPIVFNEKKEPVPEVMESDDDDSVEDRNNRIAAVIIAGITIAVVISNVIAIVFWLRVVQKT